MLPMGTIMTFAMVIGFLFALPVGPVKKLPLIIKQAARWLVLAAGCWNIFWYGLQHIGEPWGNAAMCSGVLMVMASYFNSGSMPETLKRFRPHTLILLAGFAVLYGVTISRL